jgi:hypothetical protein
MAARFVPAVIVDGHVVSDQGGCRICCPHPAHDSGHTED